MNANINAFRSKQDILILVKTYPELSKKYDETVCTVGIHKTTKKLIRLYPIRYRYLVGESKFKKYQWIKAKIKKASLDSRPESYNPIESTIETGEVIPANKDWVEREKWVLNPETTFKSLEQLIIAQKNQNISLGIIKPKEVLGFSIDKKSEKEISEAEMKKKSLLAQKRLFEPLKDLEILPFKPMLKFRCDDPDCTGHNLMILDWEIGQLYRNTKRNADWEQKIKDKIAKICGPQKDTYLILGNMARWQHVFCILGMFYPPKNRQMQLFFN